MKRFFRWLLGSIAGILTLFSLGILCIGFTVAGIWINAYVSQQQNKADYSVFNTSPQHVQAVAQRFSDDCRQIAATNDPVEIRALEQDIYQENSTVDYRSMYLAPGIQACVSKAVKDVGK